MGLNPGPRGERVDDEAARDVAQGVNGSVVAENTRQLLDDFYFVIGVDLFALGSEFPGGNVFRQWTVCALSAYWMWGGGGRRRGWNVPEVVARHAIV